MLHFPELHHFLVAFGNGQKMIKEAATWTASSWRTCRRCGLHMKGRRPEREFIFLHKRKRLFPKNDGADVHAVSSD
jgi:hypothetical protein